MNASPAITVLMPVYNAAAHLAEAMESILAQTFTDFEFLILDDGSSDDTPDILRQYARQDSRIRLEHNERNLKIPATLNKGLALARAPLVARMDADDISLPDRFAQQAAFMRAHPDIWVCGGAHTVWDKETESAPQMIWEHEGIKAALLFLCPLAHPFVMLRGDTLREHGIRYDETMHYAQDYELWIRLALRHEARFANIPQMIGRYRRHEGSISAARGKEQQEMAARARVQAFEILGCAGSAKDMEAQKCFHQLGPIKTRAAMIFLFDWAMQLRSANEKRRIFLPYAFNIMLFDRLLSLVERHPQFADISGKLIAAWPTA